jgi:hypothetical protein
VSGQHPNLVVANDTSVYWTNVSPTGDSLMMTPAAGGASSEVASSAGSITGITLDAMNVYWVESAQGGPSSVKTAPLGGGTPSMIASDPRAAQRGLAVDATTVYWPVAATGAVADMLHAPRNGGSATVLSVGQASSVDFALYNKDIYWLVGYPSCPAGSNELGCVLQAGGSCLAPYPTPALRVESDASSIYLVAAGAVTVQAKATFDGTWTALAATPGLSGPSYGLALDATRVYWTTWGAAPDGSDGTLMEVPMSLGPATTLASGLAAPTELAVNDLAVYWVNAGTATDPPTLMTIGK